MFVEYKTKMRAIYSLYNYNNNSSNYSHFYTYTRPEINTFITQLRAGRERVSEIAGGHFIDRWVVVAVRARGNRRLSNSSTVHQHISVGGSFKNDLVAPRVGYNTSSKYSATSRTIVRRLRFARTGDLPLGVHWLLFIAGGSSLTCYPKKVDDVVRLTKHACER